MLRMTKIPILTAIVVPSVEKNGGSNFVFFVVIWMKIFYGIKFSDHSQQKNHPEFIWAVEMELVRTKNTAAVLAKSSSVPSSFLVAAFQVES